MRKVILGLCGAALLSGLTAGPAVAETLLGSRKVAYLSETDVIPVPGKRRFGAIKLCVTRHAVRFRDLDVVYGNGGKDDISVRRIIRASECTRWANLRGRRRNIARIILRYDNYGNAGPPSVVTAYGR